MTDELIRTNYTPNTPGDVIKDIAFSSHELFECHSRLLALIPRGFYKGMHSDKSLSQPPTYKQLAYLAGLAKLSEIERTLLYDISRHYGLSQAHVSYMIDTLKSR